MPFSTPSITPTKILVSLSICFASTVSLPSSAAACQAGTPGCVLPVRDPLPPPRPPAVDEPGPIIDDGGGIGLWPILLGLGALAALILLLTLNGDDDDVPVSP